MITRPTLAIRLFFGTLLGLCHILAAEQRDNRDRFEAFKFTDRNDQQLLYCLLSPKNYDAKKTFPLVLFFHGAGERGDDNRRQLVHGMNDFASDEIMEKYPCFVVAPQCPKNMQWVDVPWTSDSHTMPAKPSQPLRQSLELIESLQQRFSIDKNRIYVTGLSMGGFATWDALQHRPNLFAAAIPICGGGDTVLAKSIAHIPIWVFHGDKDTVVKTERSRDMIAALKKAGGSPKYTEYAGVAHNSWSATYRNRDVYAWLFDQQLQKKR